MSNILENFKKENCCGCQSCISICPTEALYESKDEYGFTIPKIDNEKCINCGKCITACPYHKKITNNNPIITYAVLNKNDDIVKKSSSGGIFSALAKKVLEQDGYVFGATMNENFQVKHICIHSFNELYKLQKSKYVQSNTKDIYKNVKEKLKSEKKVLFTGTPCQIAGLKSFLNNDYENLICIDLVCHGVPNQELFDDYLKCLQNNIGKIEQYEFRAKKNSKNGMNWFFSYKLKNKRIIKNWPEDSFNYFYMKRYIYRDSCYNCKFTNKERASDITLCDYWGWENYHKKDFDVLSSLSGCIINSKKGQALFDLTKDELLFKVSNYENLARHNKNLNKPEKMNIKRNIILDIWKNKGYSYLDKEFRKRNKKQIIRYRILRIVPEIIKNMLVQFIHKKEI